MTEQSPEPGSRPDLQKQPPPAYGQPPASYAQPAPYAQSAPPGYGQPPAPYGYPPANGPLGKIRGTGTCILLTIVTLGIYSLFWYYATHDEMKRHSGQGLGGGLALIIAFFVGVVSPFITSHEVGELYERAGKQPPVSAVTGLWYFPGIFLLFIGPFVWFIKTNGALNNYWRSLGAV